MLKRMKNIDSRSKAVLVIVAAVLVATVVLFGLHKLHPPNSKNSLEGNSNDIVLPVEQKHEQKTTVAIAAKESSNDADVQVHNKSNYVVEVDGKKEELKPVVKETTKLENNKVVVTQENTVTTKIKLPEPSGSFGAGMNNKGELAVIADGRIYKNLSWWVYGSRTEQAAGLKVTIYK